MTNQIMMAQDGGNERGYVEAALDLALATVVVTSFALFAVFI